jgi:arylsulfatase A-like enzyme
MRNILSVILFASILNSTIHAQRNVILIIADDLSPDFFGFYEAHGDTVDVPNLRALLSRGVRFRNLYSNPVCSSTRSTILTGRYSFRTGVGGIVGGIGGSNQLDTSEITIPKLLEIYDPTISKADIGKWHLHQPTPANRLTYPNLMGYDHFEGPFIGQLPSFTNWTKYTNGVASNVTNYATTENVNNAIDWIKSLNSNSFFLWLAFNAPHEPLHLPPAGLHSFTTLSGTQANINQNPKAYFKAMIQAMDHEIGRLFDTLQVMNKFDSTDIIFIGDNGSTPRTAQIADTLHAKGTVYDYGVNVPMIISGPSVSNPGRVSDALVNTADIFATVLELFGHNNWQSQISPNISIDSRSMLPIILNQTNQIRDWTFSEIFKLTTDSADGKTIRNTDYKLIRFDYGREEFYHISIDPDEGDNLLNRTLNFDEQNNYNYLCNELTALVGSGMICTSTGTSIVNDGNKDFTIYPNPFSSFIKLSNYQKEDFYQLYNLFGTIIYTGNEIEKQDFSGLAKGIYFVKNLNMKNQIIQIVKDY